MNIFLFIKILSDNIKFLLLIPFMTAILMYVLTINQPSKYSSHATIFTGITSTNSIDDIGNNRVDYFATQNAFNNILSILLSQNVLKETSLRLLSSHLMLADPDKNFISKKSFAQLQEIVPEEIKQLTDRENFDQTFLNISNSIRQDKENFIYGLLNYDHPHYSLKSLSTIKVERLGSSDLIKISFQGNDPGICYNTIKILTEVFINKYNQLKSTQTNAAVDYFEEQLKKAVNKLKNAEDRLLTFNTQNEIINYYEQTKHISSQQEKIEIKLQDVQLEYDAAQAVLLKLETETKSRFDINLRNKEILNIREKLIDINEKIALSGLGSEDKNKKKSKQFNMLKSQLENELKNKIDSLYIYERNSQGIELGKLLGDWLKTVMEYESAKARLYAMKKKKNEFMKLYTQYAPLGAKLKRIEREIKVNEEEYLEILHHLGLAKLKQQNAEMLSNMKMLDEPTLPINSMPTNRKIYIIVASFFSLIFYVLALFIFELLDKKVKTPKILNKHTDLEVIGALCQQDGYPNYDIPEITNRSAKYLIENILFRQFTNNKEQPVIIQLISHWDNEGKTFVSHTIANQLKQMGKSCIQLNFKSSSKNKERDINSIDEDVSQIDNYRNFLSKNYMDAYFAVDYIIVELPPASESLYNPGLLQSADINYLVVEATRTWCEADNFNLKKLKKLLKENLQSVLTKANPDDIEDLIGEIPKKRSYIRKFIKYKLLKRFI